MASMTGRVGPGSAPDLFRVGADRPGPGTGLWSGQSSHATQWAATTSAQGHAAAPARLRSPSRSGGGRPKRLPERLPEMGARPSMAEHGDARLLPPLQGRALVNATRARSSARKGGWRRCFGAGSSRLCNARVWATIDARLLPRKLSKAVRARGSALQFRTLRVAPGRSTDTRSPKGVATTDLDDVSGSDFAKEADVWRSQAARLPRLVAMKGRGPLLV